MSLESLLTKVDEATWKQYEKVTNWAYQNYGWSKYGLARMCYGAESVCIVGMGTYSALDGLNRIPTSKLEIAVGTLSTMIGVYILSQMNKCYKKLEQSEMKMAISGAAIQPKFDARRPRKLLESAAICGLAAAVVSNFGPLPEQYSGTIKEYLTLGIAIGILYGLSSFCRVSSDYFSSQIPKPPKAKKSVWQALYEPIGKYFRKAIPQPEPKPEGAKISS